MNPQTSSEAGERPDKKRVRSRAWGLPLVTRELIEQSSRRRLFEVRIAYAVSLQLICFCVLVQSAPNLRSWPLGGLGSGAPVLSTLSVLQELGLYLLLPVLSCSSLTIEKERRTLDLLLLTRLSPWAIILEKFLSRLIPALNLILMSLPLIAFSYAFGGISLERVWISLMELVLTATRLAAVGIMCSAVFATTGKSLVGTYGIALMICVLEQLLQYLLLHAVAPIPGFNRSSFLQLQVIDLLTTEPGLLSLLRSNLLLSLNAGIPVHWRLMLGVLPSLLVSMMFLWLARLFLVPPKRGWSGWLFRSRTRPSGAKIRARNEWDVPLNDPVAWRETPRGNRSVWWIRNICAAGLPVAILLGVLGLYLEEAEFLVVNFIVYSVIWLAVTVRICSYTAVLIAQERVQNTLDLLLCTRLTGKDIVNQKMQHVWRLVMICRIPLFVCVIYRTWYSPDPLYPICAGLMIWFYPLMLAWQSMACGIKARTGAAAILKTAVALGIWCFAPYFIILAIGFFVALGGNFGGAIVALFAAAYVSPLTFLIVNEMAQFDQELLGIVVGALVLTPLFQLIKFAVLIERATTDAGQLRESTHPLARNLIPRPVALDDQSDAIHCPV